MSDVGSSVVHHIVRIPPKNKKRCMCKHVVSNKQSEEHRHHTLFTSSPGYWVDLLPFFACVDLSFALEELLICDDEEQFLQ